MQKLKSFFLSLLYFIVFCVLGLIIGNGIAYGFLFLDGTGVFSSWKLLGGDHQFEKIITADAQTVWAQASDGKVYSWNSNCYRENCNQWIETKEVPKNDAEYDSVTVDSSCRTNGRVRNAPGNVLECANVEELVADFWVTVYYVLLDDGNIRMLEYSGNPIGIELAPVCGSFLGIVAAIIGFIIFLIRRAVKDKEASVSHL